MSTLLAREFPDFDLASLPPIPDGWTDTSWHNDACPSFSKRDLCLFVDYADPALRECRGLARFVLLRYAGHDAVTLCTTDEWARMAGAIAQADR